MRREELDTPRKVSLVVAGTLRNICVPIRYILLMRIYIGTGEIFFRHTCSRSRRNIIAQGPRHAPRAIRRRPSPSPGREGNRVTGPATGGKDDGKRGGAGAGGVCAAKPNRRRRRRR